MRKIILLISYALLAEFSNAQGPTFQWAVNIGGFTNDACYSSAIDASGNLYTAGKFIGTVDFDPGPGTFNLTNIGIQDAYILKLDPLGNFYGQNNLEVLGRFQLQ